MPSRCVLRFTAFVVFGLAMSECAPTSWSSVYPVPGSGLAKLPRVARLILITGDTLSAYDAVLRGDSVVWEAEPSGAPISNMPMEARKRFAVALTRIKEIQSPDPAGDEAGGGATLVLAVMGALAFIGLMMSVASPW
jgi:hypothetical protein